MDLMCSLNQTVGIACLATLLQIGVGAQNAPVVSTAAAQEITAKSSSPSSMQSKLGSAINLSIKSDEPNSSLSSASGKMRDSWYVIFSCTHYY